MSHSLYSLQATFYMAVHVHFARDTSHVVQKVKRTDDQSNVGCLFIAYLEHLEHIS